MSPQSIPRISQFNANSIIDLLGITDDSPNAKAAVRFRVKCISDFAPAAGIEGRKFALAEARELILERYRIFSKYIEDYAKKREGIARHTVELLAACVICDDSIQVANEPDTSSGEENLRTDGFSENFLKQAQEICDDAIALQSPRGFEIHHETISQASIFLAHLNAFQELNRLIADLNEYDATNPDNYTELEKILDIDIPTYRKFLDLETNIGDKVNQLMLQAHSRISKKIGRQSIEFFPSQVHTVDFDT